MSQMAGWRWGSPARKVSGSRAQTSAAEAFNSPLTTESIDGSADERIGPPSPKGHVIKRI